MAGADFEFHVRFTLGKVEEAAIQAVGTAREDDPIGRGHLAYEQGSGQNTFLFILKLGIQQLLPDFGSSKLLRLY